MTIHANFLSFFLILVMSSTCVATSMVLEKRGTSTDSSAQDVISLLAMEAAPEKGYVAETFRDPTTVSGSNRSVSTAIYYLLEGVEGPSLWHRLDASEVWHFYTGASLTLQLWHEGGQGTTAAADGKEETIALGPGIFNGERPQAIVPAGVWQRAYVEGDWSLVGTTVAPGFEESGVEFKPKGWNPPGN